MGDEIRNNAEPGASRVATTVHITPLRDPANNILYHYSTKNETGKTFKPTDKTYKAILVLTIMYSTVYQYSTRFQSM